MRAPWRSSRAGACRPTADAGTRWLAAPPRECGHGAASPRPFPMPPISLGPEKLHRLADLSADGEHRIERRHRLLEDHRDVVAAYRAHLAFVELEQIAAIELDRAGDDPAGRIGNEPHHGERRHTLAAAGFTDDRHRLAPTQGKREVVDRFDDPESGKEVRPQPGYIENGPSRSLLGTRSRLGHCFVDARAAHFNCAASDRECRAVHRREDWCRTPRG